MAATYQGSYTLATLLPGLVAPLNEAIDAINAARAALAVQADAMVTAHAAIRVAVLADLQIQLDAMLAVSANMQLAISDPTAHIQALLTGLIQAQAALSIAVPQLELNAQIGASLAAAATLQASITAIDLTLSAILSIAAVIRALVPAITVSISAAGGIHMIDFSGPISDLGTDVDGVTGGTGLGPSEAVHAKIIITQNANLAASAAVTGVFSGLRQ